MNFFERYSDKIVEVSVSGCWIWMGSAKERGYGQVVSGRISPAGNSVPEGAHRAAFRSAFGEFDRSLHVCHRCDVPVCVNPDHLFLGTQADNMRDKISKGKQVSGSSHGMATMDETTVMRLRSEYVFRIVTYEVLARRHGLTASAVAAAVRGETWKKIEGKAP